MISCECGNVYHAQAGEKSLTAFICPQCGRKMKKVETWIMPLGDMTVLEASKCQGSEDKYLKQRKLKNGY